MRIALSKGPAQRVVTSFAFSRLEFRMNLGISLLGFLFSRNAVEPLHLGKVGEGEAVVIILACFVRVTGHNVADAAPFC